MINPHIHPKIRERAVQNLRKRREGIASDQRICTVALKNALALLEGLGHLPEAERGVTEELIGLYTWALAEVGDFEPGKVRDAGSLAVVRGVLQICTARLSSLNDRVAPRAEHAIAV
jgi:hypothetical protein